MALIYLPSWRMKRREWRLRRSSASVHVETRAPCPCDRLRIAEPCEALASPIRNRSPSQTPNWIETMFADRLRTLAPLLLLGIATTTIAHANGPGADFSFNAEATATSPDQQIRIEPYFKNSDDDRIVYQFWTFDT